MRKLGIFNWFSHILYKIFIIGTNQFGIAVACMNTIFTPYDQNTLPNTLPVRSSVYLPKDVRGRRREQSHLVPSLPSGNKAPQILTLFYGVWPFVALHSAAPPQSSKELQEKALKLFDSSVLGSSRRLRGVYFESCFLGRWQSSATARHCWEPSWWTAHFRHQKADVGHCTEHLLIRVKFVFRSVKTWKLTLELHAVVLRNSSLERTAHDLPRSPPWTPKFFALLSRVFDDWCSFPTDAQFK